jgi:hypothetical protein
LHSDSQRKICGETVPRLRLGGRVR